MTIIGDTLELICRTLNTQMWRATDRSDDIVILANLVDQDGATNPNTHNRIVISLSHLAPDTSAASVPRASPYARSAPALSITIDIMVIAHFSGPAYAEGLAALSQVIGFFQQMPLLNRANTPDLDPAIDQLTIELVAMSSAEVSSIMAMHGGRYFPAAFYRLRPLPILAGEPLSPPQIG